MRESIPYLSIKGNWFYEFALNQTGHRPPKNTDHYSNLKKENANYSSFGKCAQRNLNQTLTKWTLTQELGFNQFHFKNSRPLNNHTFITLTLPYKQIHCDKTIKRECLNDFLIKAKRLWQVHNLMWKAETQDNGNIHFHMLTDRYIPHEQLRYTWQNSMEKLGYISWYATENNNLNPNCTDIHAIKKIKNVAAYFSKYMTKGIKGRDICGHAWGRSENLIRLKPYMIELDNSMQNWLNSQREKIENSIYSNEHVGITKFKTIPNLETMPS